VSLEFRQQITLHLGYCHLSLYYKNWRKEELDESVRSRWNETKPEACRVRFISSVKSNINLFPAANWNDHSED